MATLEQLEIMDELQFQRRKAQSFREALAIWDRAKIEYGKLLNSGAISEEEYHNTMSKLADDLDL